MMKMIGRFLKDKCGVAATEFALMAPPLVFMILGIVDYGSYMNTTMKLEDTAMAAAQYIRAGGLEENLKNDVLLESSLGLDASNVDTVNMDVSYQYECSDPSVAADANTDCGSGDYLRKYVVVNVSTDFDTIVPYPGIPDTITLSGNVRLQDN